MNEINNPLADLAQKLGSVRVIWALAGTLVAALGITIPFVDPTFLTGAAFDEGVTLLVNGSTVVIGVISGAIAFYQRYRKVEVVDGLRAQASVDAIAKETKVPYGPFSNVVV